MNTKHKTSKKLKLAWPTAGMAMTIVTLLAGYVTFFATDYLGISPAVVGVLLMASKISDGFTDIIAGYIIDRANLKMGKGRPFQLAFLGLSISYALLFSAPEMQYVASCIWLFVTYTLANSVFLTMLNCSEAVYLANSIDDPQDAVNLSSLNGTMALVIGVIAGIVYPQLIKSVGTTRSGWALIGWGVAVLTGVMAMIRVALVKEKRRTATNQANSPKDLLHAITSNKYIILVALIILVAGIGNGVAMGVVAYYAQYVLGDIGIQSTLALANLAVIFALIFIPAISKKIGITKVIKITVFLGLIGYAGRLINPYSTGVIFGTTLLASFGFTVVTTLATVLVIDCIDYGEWKNGVRAEGTLTCAQSVTSKIGAAIGSGMIGIMMGMSGYNGSLAVQSESALNMLIILYAVVPTICSAVMLILLHFYDLDKQLPTIREELAKRKAS